MTSATYLQSIRVQTDTAGLLGGGDALSLILRKPIGFALRAALLAGTPLLGLVFVIALPLGGLAALLSMGGAALSGRGEVRCPHD